MPPKNFETMNKIKGKWCMHVDSKCERKWSQHIGSLRETILYVLQEREILENSKVALWSALSEGYRESMFISAYSKSNKQTCK